MKGSRIARIRRAYFHAIRRMCSCVSGRRYRQLQAIAATLANRMAKTDGLNLFDKEVM